MSLKGLSNEISKVSSILDLQKLMPQIKVISSNRRFENATIEIIEKSINASKRISDIKSNVILNGLLILQYVHDNGKFENIVTLFNEMQNLARNIQYQEGIAFSKVFAWYVKRIKGDYKKARHDMIEALDMLNQEIVSDEYIFYFIKYTSSVEEWTINHDITVTTNLESCAEYFYNNNYYRSFVHTLSILEIIYTRTQNGQNILKIGKRIFEKKMLFDNLPKDVKAISYYFVGLGFMLEMNLKKAETYFEESYNILKRLYKESIYVSNYLILHSYIITVKALQGKMEHTWEIMRNFEKLLEDDFFKRNLDSGTKRQIHHTLNLNKFYLYSRLKDFNSDKMQDLIIEILEGVKTLYSDFMLLSEFILSANLVPHMQKELMKIDNFSLNRVKHLISFTLLNRNTKKVSNRNRLRRIEVLEQREITSKTTFIENVLAELLIAQQLHSLRRFTDIFTLLRKYEKQLDQIQVLELRLFMEAFIQIGTYRNGNPLGLIFHYTAIRKCNNYGFTRLEARLSEYLEMQKREAMPWLVGSWNK